MDLKSAMVAGPATPETGRADPHRAGPACPWLRARELRIFAPALEGSERGLLVTRALRRVRSRGCSPLFRF